MQLASRSLLVAAMLGGATPAAAESRSLVVSIDVPEERTPDWLCVIARESCARGSMCLAAELADLPLDHDHDSLYDLGAGVPRPRAPAPVQGALAAIAARHRAADAAALSRWSSLLSPGGDADLECGSELHRSCRPQVDLQLFLHLRPDPVSAIGAIVGALSGDARPSGFIATPTGRIVCGFRPGAEVSHLTPAADRGAPSPHLGRPSRVAFIGLTFGDPSQATSGLKEVRFIGTTANITFERSLSPSVVTFAQVLGGDYVPSTTSSIGSNEHVRIKLHPRCTRFVVELPRHVELPVSAVIEAGGEAGGEELLRCKPPRVAARSLQIEIPHTKSGQEKKLTVEYEAELGAASRARTTRSEARWTEALPPASLKLGVRSLQFRWQRPMSCLAERWTEPTPASARGTWTRSCPRATLADTTICDVITGDAAANPSHCDYDCLINDRFDTIQFPIPVRFDRLRSKATPERLEHPGNSVNELVYSWTDQVSYSGQELISRVAPPDRRVMLEFADPEAWKPALGDQIDAIRVMTGKSSDQIELTGREPEDPPLYWVSMATPQRTCSDRVRLAILGTRRYDEKSFPVARGRLLLERPFDYRARFRLYALGGVGLIYDDYIFNGTASGEGGLGGQIDLGGPWSLNFEFNGQLTQRFWNGIELPKRMNSELLSFLYLRVDARLGGEVWLTPRWGVAAFGGVGIGTPLRFADDRKVDKVSVSFPLEVVPFVFNVLPRRAWLLFALGARVGEPRIDFKTDFAGDPIAHRSHRPQIYMSLKLRGILR